MDLSRGRGDQWQHRRGTDVVPGLRNLERFRPTPRSRRRGTSGFPPDAPRLVSGNSDRVGRRLPPLVSIADRRPRPIRVSNDGLDADLVGMAVLPPQRNASAGAGDAGRGAGRRAPCGRRSSHRPRPGAERDARARGVLHGESRGVARGGAGRQAGWLGVSDSEYIRRQHRGQVERSGNHEGGAGGLSGSRSQDGTSRSAWSTRQTSTWSPRST